ncbi:MAG: hypothetical protein ACD_9C00113G0002 [uncultured bacterium]|nr:MAG: hypothetical protein ACD_9C00113G0002 [uncultured bacterium]
MKKIKILNKKRFVFFVAGIAILIALLIWAVSCAWDFIARKTELNRAGKEGEVKTLHLMVQINQPKGDPEIIAQGFQRGDIVLFSPEEKEFSIAEKEGFLIIKVRLTEAQANLLTSSFANEQEKFDPKKELKKTDEIKQKPLRSYFVDLEKIGIAKEEERGKVISDKVFEWKEIVKEK